MINNHETNTGEPSPEEIHFAAAVINRLPKGFLPRELFEAIAAKTTTPTMEVAPIRHGVDGEPEILLT